jgi:hypothetical protein
LVLFSTSAFVSKKYNRQLKDHQLLKSPVIGLKAHITGIEFLRTLKHPPHVIITTAYRDLYIEAFTSSSIEVAGKELPIGRSFKNGVVRILHAGNPVMAN